MGDTGLSSICGPCRVYFAALFTPLLCSRLILPPRYYQQQQLQAQQSGAPPPLPPQMMMPSPSLTFLRCKRSGLKRLSIWELVKTFPTQFPRRPHNPAIVSTYCRVSWNSIFCEKPCSWKQCSSDHGLHSPWASIKYLQILSVGVMSRPHKDSMATCLCRDSVYIETQ